MSFKVGANLSLISVDRHEAKVVPITVRQRMTHVSDEGHETNYSRFLGCGPPHHVLGRPGDIFVDITKGAYGIFVKDDDCWLEWIGVIKLIGGERRQGLTVLVHPLNARLVLWCTKKEVLWMDRAKLTAARGVLFARHPGRSKITAREMIEESPELVTEIEDMYKAERERQRELEREQQRELKRESARAYWYCDLISPPLVRCVSYILNLQQHF